MSGLLTSVAQATGDEKAYHPDSGGGETSEIVTSHEYTAAKMICPLNGEEFFGIARWLHTVSKQWGVRYQLNACLSSFSNS